MSDDEISFDDMKREKQEDDARVLASNFKTCKGCEYRGSEFEFDSDSYCDICRDVMHKENK